MLIFTKISCVFGKIVILKNTVLALFYENNVIRVYKINWSTTWPIITDSNTAKMWPIKLISDY